MLANSRLQVPRHRGEVPRFAHPAIAPHHGQTIFLAQTPPERTRHAGRLQSYPAFMIVWGARYLIFVF